MRGPHLTSPLPPSNLSVAAVVSTSHSWREKPEAHLPLYPWVCVCVLSCFSCVRLFSMIWTIAHQASLSMGFFRQEYWSGLSCPPPGDLPDTGIKPLSSASPALAGEFFTTSATWEDRTLGWECALLLSSHLAFFQLILTQPLLSCWTGFPKLLITSYCFSLKRLHLT